MSTPTGGTVQEITLGNGDVVRVRELNMGEYRQLQRFVNSQPRPRSVSEDLAEVYGALADRFHAELGTSGLDGDRKAEVIRSFSQAALRSAEQQMREARYEAAMWPPEMGSAEAGKLLMTADGGQEYLTWVVLNQEQKGRYTREQADAIFNDMAPAEFFKMLNAAFGRGEGEAAEASDAPKA